MKNKSDFIKFYNKEYKKIIETEFTEELKKYQYIKLGHIIINILFVIIVFSFFIFMNFENSFKFLTLMCFLNVFVLYIIYDIYLLKRKKKKFYSKVNRLIYYDILHFITNGNTLSYYPNSVLDINEFNQMNLFNLDILTYDGKNFTSLVYLDKPLIFCDVILSTIKEKYRQETHYDEQSNTKYIYDIYEEVEKEAFNGLYYETIIDRENNDFIYLIPNNFNDKFIDKNIHKFIKYKGKEIKLENLELSIKYEIYSLDEHQSRYMLTPLFMEKINKLDKLIPNKKYIVFKEDGRVGIFIDDFSIEKLLERKIIYNNKTIDKKYLINYFNDINKIVQISQTLKYHK